MTIDQITDTVRDQEARDHIRRQYQSDLQVLGEREALEFARFRAAHAYAYDLAAIAHQQAAQRLRRLPFARINTRSLIAAQGQIVKHPLIAALHAAPVGVNSLLVKTEIQSVLRLIRHRRIARTGRAKQTRKLNSLVSLFCCRFCARFQVGIALVALRTGGHAVSTQYVRLLQRIHVAGRLCVFRLLHML